MTFSRLFIAAIVATVALAGSASTGSACSVPVFRYALELWPPDDYPLWLFHRGTPEGEDRELIDRLRAARRAGGGNIRFEAVDVDAEMEAGPASVWESLGDEERDLGRPLLVLRVPARTGLSATVLTLDLSAEHVDQLLGSPAREEIAERILNDHSVVWVLLESGDEDRDDRLFGVLNTEIARLEGSLEMPQPDAADLLSADAEPLKLIFSSMRISRDDPAERAFVAMLLNVESDLADPEFDGEPMVFPVFGRGRALYALVGEGIVPATIEDAARYLTGACQCTVKAENPGADLLMAVDWDRLVIPTIEEADAPPLGGLASFAEPDREPEPTPSPEPEPAAEVASATESEPRGPGADAEDGADAPPAPAADRGAIAGTSSGEATAGDGPRLGLSALMIVGVMGVAVLLASVVLTRRDG